MKPIQMIVWAIVAIALILLFVNYIIPEVTPENVTTIIRNNFVAAENPGQLGKLLFLGEIDLEKDELVSQSMFELTDRELAFECTSVDECCAKGEKCNKAIEWDYTHIKTKRNTKSNLYLRCIKDELPICRAYVGKQPAQAEIINLVKDQDNTSISLQVFVENTGEFDLAFGKNSLILQKKVGERWFDGEEEFETKEIERIPVDGQHIFVWEINPQIFGEYRAITKFEGNNAGFDEKSVEFTITENTACVTIDKNETTFDGDIYKEIHYCEGCNYAFECLAEWNKKNPTIDYELMDLERVYCTKNSFEGVC
jgi:hypothetical protein